MNARIHHLLPALSFAVFAALGCGDDATDPAGSTTVAGGTTTTGGSGGTAANGGGGSGGATGGSGGSSGGANGGGGSGGMPGFPWEGAIDPSGGPASERLVPHEFGSTTAPQGFFEYTPAGYPSSVQWPLLIALHGIGENGNGTNELGDVLATGIPDLIEKDQWPNDRPFVVLMPQHPGGGCPGAGEIESFIAWGIENYDIDPRYVYLTGLSCGAIGAWNYLQQNLGEQIAAFVPVAGDGTGAWNAVGCDLAQVGIWAFHGDADRTVNVSGTNVPMDGLATCPSPPALETKKTIYPDVDHDSWSQTYNGSAGHDIYSWFLNFTNE